MKKIKNGKNPKGTVSFIILFTIAIIITMICVCNIIRRTDFTAATSTEWDYLHEQVATFKEKGIEPFFTREDVEVNVKGNSVKIETEECGEVFERDNEHNLKKVKSFDKAYLNGDAIGLIIALVLGGAFTSIILFIIEVIVVVIYLKWVQLCINLAKKAYKK